jgi:hypothetical protein
MPATKSGLYIDSEGVCSACRAYENRQRVDWDERKRQQVITVVIQQPTYLPWMGYFDLVAQADIFVFLDSVQFERRSWQSRNRLRSAAGQPFWLTVPVEKAPRETIIRDIKIVRRELDWTRKHLNSIKMSLGRAAFYETYRHIVDDWINHDVLLLSELNIALITDIARLLGFTPLFVRSSDLAVAGRKASLIMDICKLLGATRYYSAQGSSGYLSEDAFRCEGIDLEYQSWQHPEYKQAGKGFVSHLSVIDALTNIGAEQTRAFILGP